MVLTVTSLLPPHFLVTKILSVVGFLWVMAYLPMALVRNYQQGYLKTIAKLVVFGFIYVFVIAFALFWTLVVAALTSPDKPAVESTNVPVTKALKN